MTSPTWAKWLPIHFCYDSRATTFVRTASAETAPRTFADVYQQVTTWIQQQHNAERPYADPLGAEHLAGLRRLSYGLLFETSAAHYLFHAQELSDALGHLSSRPVMESRFIHRLDREFDEFGFLHATVQEFFAACHAAKLADGELEQFLDRAFQQASRMIVLEFAAGLGGAVAEHCQRRAVNWLDGQDRFGQYLLRRGPFGGRRTLASKRYRALGVRTALANHRMRE